MPIWEIWAWRAWRLPGRWPDGGLSEGYGHSGPSVCLGDGQTEDEGVPSHGGRGDALLRRMPPYLTWYWELIALNNYINNISYQFIALNADNKQIFHTIHSCEFINEKNAITLLAPIRLYWWVAQHYTAPLPFLCSVPNCITHLIAVFFWSSLLTWHCLFMD